MIPYTLQNKGTIENRIDVIRRFYHRKKTLEKLLIKEVERLINYRLVGKFNYNNPIEILNNKIISLYGVNSVF